MIEFSVYLNVRYFCLALLRISFAVLADVSEVAFFCFALWLMLETMGFGFLAIQGVRRVAGLPVGSARVVWRCGTIVEVALLGVLGLWEWSILVAFRHGAAFWAGDMLYVLEADLIADEAFGIAVEAGAAGEAQESYVASNRAGPSRDLLGKSL